MKEKETRTGRKSKYETLHIAEKLESVRGWAKHGGKKAVADTLHVSVNTVSAWQAKYTEFREALKTGEVEANGELLASAFDLGTGYYREVTEVIKVRTAVPDASGRMVTKEEEKLVKYEKYFPPDPRMLQFLLMNRMKADYRKAPEPEQDPNANSVRFTFDGSGTEGDISG